MTEFESHIAEVEGIKTPTRKRSKKEIEAAFDGQARCLMRRAAIAE